MVFVYIAAIVVVSFLIMLFFALNKDKQEKHLQAFKNGKLGESKSEVVKAIDEKEQKEAEVIEDKIIEEQQGELENFSLESASDKNTKNDEDISNQDDEKSGGDTKSFEESFAEYERFLRENNISFDDLEDDDEEFQNVEASDSDLKKNIDNLPFNLDIFEGKTREEIAEMIKDLSEEEQSVVLNEILSRRSDE